jgi:hypothetical protein
VELDADPALLCEPTEAVLALDETELELRRRLPSSGKSVGMKALEPRATGATAEKECLEVPEEAAPLGRAGAACAAPVEVLALAAEEEPADLALRRLGRYSSKTYKDVT